MNNIQAMDRLPEVLPQNPMELASEWFTHAQEQAAQRNPNAMSLVSVGDDLQPSVRIVLCKAFVAEPGYLVFYTNYQSRKSTEISAHPRVAAVMHWDALGRQIRIEGQAVRSPASESDAYFATRGWGSQLGAWGSDQSRPLESRDKLIEQLRARANDLGVALGEDTNTLASATPPTIPRPPHWGGFRIWIQAIELWVEGGDRIHDRARWHRTLTAGDAQGFAAGSWSGNRLQP
ncbi:pyridoxamine 5'-phosphate oxidase [Woeseia oceani]|nr:pyridoxamine 5'-phosphate oxidase [Woeseia oceani]